jgi:hypothetical protein
MNTKVNNLGQIAMKAYKNMYAYWKLNPLLIYTHVGYIMRPTYYAVKITISN